MKATVKNTDNPVNAGNLVNYIMDYEGGDLSDMDTLNLFSHLIKTGMAWTLQGSYGRTAHALIESNWIAKNGDLNTEKIDDNGIN